MIMILQSIQVKHYGTGHCRFQEWRAKVGDKLTLFRDMIIQWDLHEHKNVETIAIRKKKIQVTYNLRFRLIHIWI